MLVFAMSLAPVFGPTMGQASGRYAHNRLSINSVIYDSSSNHGLLPFLTGIQNKRARWRVVSREQSRP
jgi:hypothetical protein